MWLVLIALLTTASAARMVDAPQPDPWACGPSVVAIAEQDASLGVSHGCCDGNGGCRTVSGEQCRSEEVKVPKCLGDRNGDLADDACVKRAPPRRQPDRCPGYHEFRETHVETSADPGIAPSRTSACEQAERNCMDQLRERARNSCGPNCREWDPDCEYLGRDGRCVMRHAFPTGEVHYSDYRTGETADGDTFCFVTCRVDSIACICACRGTL